MGQMIRRDRHRNKKHLGNGVVDVVIQHDQQTRRMSEITFSIVAAQYEYELTLGPKESEQLRYLLSIERAPPPNPGI